METTVGRAEGCTPESEVPTGSAPGRRCGLRSGAAAKGSRFRARKKGHRVVEVLAFEDSGASCDDFVTESLSQSSRSSDALGNAPAHRVQMGTKAGALRMAPPGGRGRNRASSLTSEPASKGPRHLLSDALTSSFSHEQRRTQDPCRETYKDALFENKRIFK